MKKNIILFFVAAMCLFVTTSCNANIHDRSYKDYGYYVAGVYFYLDNTVTTLSMEDSNPKVYFNFAYYEEKQVIGIGTHGGYDLGWTTFYQTSKDNKLKDKIMECYGYVSLQFVNYEKTTATVYPLYYDGSKYIIDVENKEEAILNRGTYHFKTTFKMNNQKFKCSLNLNFKSESEE